MYEQWALPKKRRRKVGSYILIGCLTSPTTNFFMIITTKWVEESPVFLREDCHSSQFQILCSTNIFSQMLKYLSYFTCIFTKVQSWSLYFSFHDALLYSLMNALQGPGNKPFSSSEECDCSTKTLEEVNIEEVIKGI